MSRDFNNNISWEVFLTCKIKEKEIEVRKSKNKKKTLIELKPLQEQLNSCINKQIERRNKMFRQKEFQGTNKPGRFLAWQVKNRRKEIYNKRQRLRKRHIRPTGY